MSGLPCDLVEDIQSSPMSGLPSDLVEDILSRVPATSLNRLWSTCKEWNHWFNDHIFTKRQFDKAPKEYLELLLIDFQFFSMSLNLRGLHENIDQSIELKGEVTLTNPCTGHTMYVFEVFHCGGLLLCTSDSEVMVWNPCTGQTRWIQTECTVYNKDLKYALGYEKNKSCHNFKILRFLDSHETSELEIYDLKSNSWRIIDSVIPDFEIRLHGVSVNGNTYWVAADRKDQHGNEFLISFDFTLEKFGPRLCLPYIYFYALSSVREERLSVLFQDEDALTMEIWMTNKITETKDMSWSRFLKIDLNTHQFWNRDISFFIDVENKVAVCCDELMEESLEVNSIVYIIGDDHKFRKVNLRQEQGWPRLFSYAPSLVQI